MRPTEGTMTIDTEGRILTTGYKTPGIKRVNEKHYRVGRLKVKGLTHDEIRQKTGYSPTHITRILSNPTVKNEMERYKKKLSESALDKLIASTPKAADVLIDDLEITGEDPRLRKLRQTAAIEVLDKASVGGKNKDQGETNFNQQINVNISTQDLMKEVLEFAEG